MANSLIRGIYHALFRTLLRLRCWFADRSGSPGVPPAMLRFRVCESLSTREFLRIGEGCARLIEEHLPLAPGMRVLDFGCGCGRTLRWLLRTHVDTEFHGVDVDGEAIDWCRDHLKPGHFLANGPAPPLPYANGYFDVIYCFSVFTHLDESMQDQWLAELCRVLKPDGVLLLTVHGDAAAKSLDPDSLAALRTTGFVHQRSRKLKGLVPDWYHTTWHSRDYIVRGMSAFFNDVRYTVVPDGLQDIVTAHGREPAPPVPAAAPRGRKPS